VVETGVEEKKQVEKRQILEGPPKLTGEELYKIHCENLKEIMEQEEALKAKTLGTAGSTFNPKTLRNSVNFDLLTPRLGPAGETGKTVNKKL